MAHRDPVPGQNRTLLAILVVASLAFNLMPTMVAPAMPAIQRDLDATTTGTAWVLTGYLLSAAVFTPVVARLGDIHGRERVLLATLGVFALGLVAAALGRTLTELVAARVLQGVVGGAILPLTFGILRDRVPPDRVASGVSVLTATIGVGGSIGLVVAGVVVDTLSYRWLFWLGVGMTAVAALLVRRLEPQPERRRSGRVDWVGALLLGLALTALLVAIGRANAWGWTAPPTIGLAVAGAVGLAGWAAFELRAPAPLVDVRLLRRRAVWTGNVISALGGWCMFGAFLLVPQFVQVPRVFGGYGFDGSVTLAGLVMVPCSIALLVGGAGAARVARAVGQRAVLLGGFGIVALGFGVLLPAHATLWQVGAAVGAVGLGLGFVLSTMAALVLRAVPSASTGEATSTTVIMRTIGGALGAQVAAALLDRHLVIGSVVPAEAGYVAAFAVCGAMGVVGLALAASVPRRKRASHR